MINSANVVSLREGTEPGAQNARVVSISGQEAEVRLSGCIRKARVAFSCLVRPMAGDLVLCTENESGEHYILGIIERPGAQNMVISFPADATMLAKYGAFSVVSGKAVTLASGDRLNCFSGQAVHKSREAVVDFEDLTARGESLQVHFQTVRLITRMMNTLARHVIDKFKTYVRHTEDYDQVKSGQMTRKVDGLYSMDSQNTVMVSKKDTKIDGKRIYMG